MNRASAMALTSLIVLSLTACAPIGEPASHTDAPAVTPAIDKSTPAPNASAVPEIVVPEARPPALCDAGNGADVGEFLPYEAYTEGAYALVSMSGGKASPETEGVRQYGGYLKIDRPGVYVLEGTYRGGILVDAKKDDDVRIVLNGTQIENPDGAAIYVKKAGRFTLSLAPGTSNTLADGATYTNSAFEDAKGAVHAKCTTIVNGAGALSLKGNGNNGLHVKGGLFMGECTIEAETMNNAFTADTTLFIRDGVFHVAAGGGHKAYDNEKGKAFRAGDWLQINGGEFLIDSADDALHSKDLVLIKGGEFLIQTGDDAVHADGEAAIYGGNLQIPNCYEGIEGHIIEIHGGVLSINADDDGLNVAGGGTDTKEIKDGARLMIYGGSIDIVAKSDGLDANGDIFLYGGDIRVNGAEKGKGDGAIDYDGCFEVHGGSLIGAGGANIEQAPPSNCGQPVLYGNLSSAQKAGTTLKLIDQHGALIMSYQPPKNFQQVYFSHAELTVGETYTVMVDESIAFQGTLLSMVMRMDE
ncbi:carbohydrate-binding domain-containing protein [Christensenellaceae bacterium OttesenSCG-928-M15]|nr:carbohydrate-binding domain-containing protein [Christensenellaceae bacterium OttesenSCG-928-M15]